jgi:hypothetical protein
MIRVWFGIIVLLLHAACGAHAADLPAVSRGPHAQTTGVFAIAKLSGSIDRGVYPYRGRLTLRGTLPAPDLISLAAYTNTPQFALVTLNNGKVLGSGAFVRKNKAGTLLLFRTRIKAEKWLLTTTLRLKKGVLHVTLAVVNEPDLDAGLGTANQDTDGWLKHDVGAVLCLTCGDGPRTGAGAYRLREKSQMDKKTIYK